MAAQTVQEANAAVNEALDMMGKKEGVVLLTKETPDDGTYSLMITASDGETGAEITFYKDRTVVIPIGG